jgi:hypothetical protein
MLCPTILCRALVALLFGIVDSTWEPRVTYGPYFMVRAYDHATNFPGAILAPTADV